MSTKLTPLLARFVASMNIHDSTAFTACFTEEAVVEDEGQTHRGRSAIQSWIDKAFANYAPKLDLQEVIPTTTGSILSGTVFGTFPGSPILLHYHLTHDAASIHALRCEA